MKKTDRSDVITRCDPRRPNSQRRDVVDRRIEQDHGKAASTRRSRDHLRTARSFLRVCARVADEDTKRLARMRRALRRSENDVSRKKTSGARALPVDLESNDGWVVGAIGNARLRACKGDARRIRHRCRRHGLRGAFGEN
jgi:hypothetical protein